MPARKMRKIGNFSHHSNQENLKIISGYEERIMDKMGRIIIPTRISGDNEYHLRCEKDCLVVYPSSCYQQSQDRYLGLPALNQERIEFFSAMKVGADKLLHRITVPKTMRRKIRIEGRVLCSLNGNGDCIIIKPKKN